MLFFLYMWVCCAAWSLLSFSQAIRCVASYTCIAFCPVAHGNLFLFVLYSKRPLPFLHCSFCSRTQLLMTSKRFSASRLSAWQKGRGGGSGSKEREREKKSRKKTHLPFLFSVVCFGIFHCEMKCSLCCFFSLSPVECEVIIHWRICVRCAHTRMC